LSLSYLLPRLGGNPYFALFVGALAQPV